jgi:hypothetical protein
MNADAVHAAPLRASVFTRVIYVVALVGFIFGSRAAASSWIGLALGGGFIGHTDPGVFILVTGALLYRGYFVVRDRAALDARPPHVAGWLLRAAGLLLMAAGAAGTASLFLVKPITLLLFRTPGDAGIAYFGVGLVATVMAGIGPIGCAVFELSRLAGRKLSAAALPRNSSRRRQDRTVLVAISLLAAVVLVLPSISRLTKGPVSGHVVGGQCVAPVLLECAGHVESRTSRVTAVAPGSAVRLRSDIEAIEYRHPGLRPGMSLQENVREALSTAGYRVAAVSEVFVEVNAIVNGNMPVLELRITDGSGDVARFTTSFARGAKLETTNSGARRIVVEFGRDVSLPLFRMPGPDGKTRLADGLYAQIRKVLVSGREAAVLAATVPRTAVATFSAPLPTGYKYSNVLIPQICSGIAVLRTQTAPEMGVPPVVSALHEIAFIGGEQTALLNHGEAVSCHGGAVWFVRYEREQQLQVRRYDLQGHLQRAWRVALPQVPKDVSRLVEPDSFQESGGQVQLRMYVLKRMGDPRPELQSFVFPA